MNAKKLTLLVVVAAVLVGLAVVQQRKGRIAAAPGRTGLPVLAGLPVNDVARIVVSSPDRTATVARAEEVWVSKDKHDYPADFSKVRQTLLTLSDLKIGQVLQLNDEQRRRLKLAAPGSTNAPAAAVELYRADGSRLAALQLGEERKRQPAGGDEYGGYPDGRYVSPDGGKTVVLVADTLSSLSDDPTAWLDTEVANVDASDVEEVSIAAPGLPELVFRKSGNDMVLDGLADDEEMDSSKNYSIKSALGYLRFKDVADPSLPDGQTGLSTGAVYRAVTAKGEIYTATVGNAAPGGEDRYVRLTVALKPAAAPAADTNATDAASATNAAAAAASETQAKERRELEEKVAKANAKVSGWTYVIAKYQADSMCLTRAEVVKKKEAKAEAPETPPAAEPGAAAVEVVTPPVAVTNVTATADAPVK